MTTPPSTPSSTCAPKACSVLLDCTRGQLPALAHWGADLGEVSAADALRLVEGGVHPDPPEHRGRAGPRGAAPRVVDRLGRPPGSQRFGSRGGRDWSPRFTATALTVAGRAVESPGDDATVVAGGCALVEVAAVDDVARLRLLCLVELLPGGVLRSRARVTNLAATAYQLDDLVLAYPSPGGYAGAPRPLRPLGPGMLAPTARLHGRRPPPGGTPRPDGRRRGHRAARRDAGVRLRPRGGVGGAHRMERQPHPLRRTLGHGRAGRRRRGAAAPRSLSFCMAASVTAQAQTKEIRVLLANHPYGDLLKAAIPEFEQATGIKVNAREPPGEPAHHQADDRVRHRLFHGGRVHDPSAAGREDVLQERLVRAAHGLRLLRLPEERHERRHLRDARPTSCRSSPSGRSSTTGRTSSRRPASRCPTTFAELEAAAKKLNSDRRRRLRLARQGRRGGHPAVELRLQLRRPLPRQGQGRVRLQARRRRHPLLRQDARQLRARRA